MKKVIVLFMLLLIFVQSTSQLWITISFFINQDYIARVLCINRDKPESGCNGACQLKKQIEKDKENQEQSNIDIKVKEVLVYIPVVAPQVQSAYTFELTEKKFSSIYFKSYLPEGHLHSIFHPPASFV